MQRLNEADAPVARDGFSFSIPLRFSDIDTFGHVNHVRYHEFLDEARCKFLQAWLDVDPMRYVLVRIELDHHSELRLEMETVDIQVWVDHVGRSSLRLGHELSDPSGELVARGSTVVVAWDAMQRGKRAIGDAEREKLLLG